MNSEEIFNNIKNNTRTTVTKEFDPQEVLKSIGLDKTQDIDKNVADQKIEPQYVDVDKPKFVQPERRSYFVAGNVNNNEINTTAQRPNEIEYEADVVDDEKKKDNYFGLTKLATNKKDIVKNALKYVVQAPNLIQNAANTIGMFTGKSGEDVALEGIRGFAGSTVDFASAMTRFFGQNYMYLKGMQKELLDNVTNLGSKLAGGEDFSDDIKQKYTDFYNRIDRQTQEFKDKTERFLQYTGIGKTDKDGFIYDLVGGGASLLYAIGATVVTKSPAATAEIFGAYQYQSLYEEAIENGFNPLKARLIGVAGGTFEGLLEGIGLHVLIEGLVARKGFTKILRSAATELVQEASQQGAEEILTTATGMREETLKDALFNVGYAGLIGALIGGGVAGISNTRFVRKMISDSATKELINIGVKDEYAKQMVNNMLNFSVSPQVADELNNMLKDEQSPVTYKNADPRETYKEFGDTVKKALDPAQKRGVELELIQANKKLTQERANVLLNSGKAKNSDEAYRMAEQQTAMYDVLAREAYNQEGIRPEDYYKRFHVNAQSGNIEIDERNVDEDNPFVDVSFDPVDFDPQARAEYEAAMDAEQDYMDQVEKENKTTLKKEARILGDMGIGAIRRPTPDGVGKDRWGEYKDLSNRIKNYFFSDDPTAMSWDDAQKLLETSSSSIKDLFAYLAAVDDRAVTLNQPGVFNRVLAKEKEDIKQKAIADGTFLKAPNGKESNLPEQLWLTVRTKVFKNWFGDWLNDPQNASKVVDANGEPLVVYHGTANDFRVFDKNKSYQGLFWFSNDYNKVNAGYDGAAGKGIVMPVFLNIKNAADWDLYDKYSPEELENMKYDGLLLKDGNETVAVAFDNKQIKSINNRGSFDKNNPDIYYQPAWHGGPRDFDRFDLNFALTGEGSMAHAWGVYGAQQRNVSEAYRKTLARDKILYDGKEISNEIKDKIDIVISNLVFYDDENKLKVLKDGIKKIVEGYKKSREIYEDDIKRYKDSLDLLNKNKDKTLSELNVIAKNVFPLNTYVDTALFNEEEKEKTKEELLQDFEKTLKKQIEIFKENIKRNEQDAKELESMDLDKWSIKQNKGQLYRLDIPENDVLLDEQKYFDEQPKKVQEALLKIGKDLNISDLQFETKDEFLKRVENKFGKKAKDILEKVYDIESQRDKEERESYVKQETLQKVEQAWDEWNKFEEENNIDRNEFDPNYVYRIIRNARMTGRAMYENIAYYFLHNKNIYSGIEAAKQASLLLNKYGVKGETYEGGRDGRAFVIFDDKAVKILEKLYQQQEQQEQPRGATTVYDRQYFIDLFSGSDKSTLLHETGHVFLSEILYFARSKNASKKVLEIKKRLDEWLGEPEDNGRYSKRQQELFAGASEVYFMEGKAPTPKLKTVFERFKKWLTDIYDAIRNDLPKINDDVRELFDNILSRSYDVPDSNIYAGKESAIKEVIKNIQEGRASEVDGITIDDVYNLLNMAYTRKPSRPSKNLKQLLNDKNIYDFNELNKAGADTVLQILKDGGYVKEDATVETAMDLAKKALDGEPVYRLADQWRVAGDIDFARNLRVLEKVIEFSQIDSVMEKILTLQEEGYRNVEQGDVEQVKDEYKRLMSADVKEAKKIVEDIINRLHKKRFIDRAAQKQMIVDLNFSSTVEEIKESVLNVIEDLQDEIKLVKEQLRNPRKPIVRKDKTIPPGKNATEEEKNNYKKYMRKQINKLLKQALPRKQNQQKFSKFDVQTQRFFEELIRINKMSREEAERFAMDRIAKDNEWILKDEKGEGFENKQKIINMFVSYKSKIITQNSPELLKELYDSLQKINIAGRNEKQINDYLTKEKRNKDMDELLDNIDKNGSKSKVSKWIKTFYNYAVANWYSCINSIAGEKQAEKDALELLEKDVMVKAKTITNRIITRSCKALGLKTTKQFDEKIHEYLKEEHEFIQSKIDHNGKEVQRKQTFNKMELICCYIWSKNKQLKERIIRAYGNEQFNEMMAKLDKGDIAWGDIIQEETASLYDDVNKVYVKMYGLDMPQTENYFPSTTVRIQGNMDLLKDAIIQTSSPSFLKGRVDSNLVVMKFGNPINIAFNHIAKASRYAVMQEKLADICKVYLHPDVSDRLKDVYGSDKIFDYIKKMLDNIKFTNFTKQVDIVNDMLNAAANTYVMTRIAGKISIMIKQLLSFTNYIEDVDSALWLKHFGKMISNPFKFKQIKEFMYKHSPYLKLRYESGAQNEALEKAMEAEAKTILKIKTFKGMLTLLTRVGDIGAIIFGGYPMVQAQLEKGVPIEKAFENFEKATLRSQQANFSSTLSNWQNYCKQNAFLRAIFAFTNTPNQYTRKLVDICFKMAHGDESFINGKGFKTLVLYGVVQSLLYNSFTSLALLSGWFGGDWDDLKDDVWLSLFQVSNFLAFPILGQIYNQVVTMYVTGDYVQDKRVPIIDDMTAFFKAMKKAYDDGFGEMGIEDWVSVTDKLASITTGIPLKTLYNSYITSWGDIINGDYGKGFVKLYGATESRANKIFD